MHNRLQLAAQGFDSRVADYAAMLLETRPAGCLMSGSGSTMYALARSADDAQRIAAELKTRTKGTGVKIIATRSL
jgi:4-diphosphocytidyl-2C-methyl-D-erythritol kinase